MGYRQTATLETLRLRAHMLSRVREFFAARAVLEVETPALSEAAPTDPALESIAANVHGSGRTHYLQTSPEFAMKRLLAAGCGDLFQLCRVFRDGELGRWHQPEFTMLEWYRVGWDEARLMDEVEALVRHAAAHSVAAWPAARVTYAGAFADLLDVDPHAVAAGSGAARLADRLAALGIDVPEGLDADALLDLAFSTVVQPGLPRSTLTFLYDYPVSQAALAKKKGGTPPVAARFELFAGGLELANGYAELTDAAEQRRRFEADQQKRVHAQLPTRPLDERLLAALERMPDCAGVALGFDRLVALAAALPTVAAAMSFAHEPPDSRPSFSP
jgi:lysyl-tRNA synthetase class 2